MKGTLAIVLLSFWMSSVARADEAPVAAPAEEDPACVLKHPSDLCSMADGSGGVCSRVTCAEGRSCLRCTAAPLNSPESKSYTLFIVIGALISLGGLVFVFRLRKHWK